MRIVCMIPTMGFGGGAERVMAWVAAHLSARHEVTLATLEPPGAPSCYLLPVAVRRVRLDCSGGGGLLKRFCRILERLWAIRQLMRRESPDVVLSFINVMNVTVLLACMGLKAPVVISERTDPATAVLSRFKAAMRWMMYPRAARLVVQTTRAARYFSHIPPTRVEVLPNPVALPSTAACPATPVDGRFRLVGLGRLSPEKGFDRLIAAFAALASRHPAWDLWIYGEGPDRAALLERARAAGVAERVHLPGLAVDVDAVLRAGHVFAFLSRFEGFPNALAEAMASGLPAVVTAGVSGVEEMAVDGETALFTPQDAPERTVAALDRLMGDAALRARMGAAARVRAARWAPERILPRWEAILSEVAGRA